MVRDLRITLIATGNDDSGILKIRLQSKGYQVVRLERPSLVMGYVYADPPDIFIIDLSVPDAEMLGVVRDLRGDSYFSTIPVIGLLTDPMVEDFDWQNYQIDDFVSVPVKYPELFSRIGLSVARILRVFDNNPLTKLPGNTSIQRAIEKAIGRPMAVCYIDINNFKPYNDVYGFSKGDVVLRMLARIMFNAVKESGGGFAGHVGGDDFVFILPQERAETVCKTIIENFDRIVNDLFEGDELVNGYYKAKNRKGEDENMPLLGIAIAVVPTDSPAINHYGKVSEVAAEMKMLAKKSGKSNYVIDRRLR